MISSAFIDVAIALPVEHTYTYGLPDHLRERARIGMRVLVPFGRRRVTGYITGGQESDRGYRIRDILDILDAQPLFSPDMVPFFNWMARYYIHPIGEVIKTALPGGLERHDVTRISKAPDTGPDRAALNAGEKQVLAHLAGKESLSLQQLSRLTKNPSIHSLIRRMAAAGQVFVRTELKKEAATMKRARFLKPGDRVGNAERMSVKRRRILDMVKGSPGISLNAVKKEVPTAVRLIKPLAEQGWLRIVEKQVFRDPLGDPVDPDVPPELTEAQADAINRIISDLNKGFQPYLLFGVTGSGKTEVYMQLAAAVVKSGKKALVLVPEISLISQTERRFRARFQNRVAVIHSALTHAQRLDQWYRILKGSVDVVIGARSCIFAPLDPLGLVIVDEEHDPSYKQENGLRYNARDMALVRGQQTGIPVVLGSATPSVQSYYNARQQRFSLLRLDQRINRQALPRITCVDLRQQKKKWGRTHLITPELTGEIRACLDRGEQALIFLNRRGFASFPVCRDCGQTLSCSQCDVTLTYHKSMDAYLCHLCGRQQPAVSCCPECNTGRVSPLGFGTEKIELLLKKMFPDARLVRMDQDTTRKKGQTLAILKSIKNRTVDIIVGTQMLAKGHDFPSITLVGIVCADLSLSLPDFRASERTFQILAQVAGRAGRGDRMGKVIMQAHNPDHFSMEAAIAQDFEAFYEMEMPFRKALAYPPFSRIILLCLSGTQAARVEKAADIAAKALAGIIAGMPPTGGAGVQVLGPAQAAIGRISSQYRWQVLIKGPRAADLNRMVRSLVEGGKLDTLSDVKLTVDVDPYSLM